MAATNTNPQENPAPTAGLQAGYRQTIGDPGAPGVTVRTILELFNSPAVTRAALAATVKGYEGVGCTQLVDPSAWASVQRRRLVPAQMFQWHRSSPKVTSNRALSSSGGPATCC